MSLDVAAHRPVVPTAARPRVRARVAAIPRPLAALLAVGVVLAVAWTVVMAPLQGPDESAHLAYAQQLAETGDGPTFDPTDGGTWSSEEAELISWGELLPLVGAFHARPGWTQAEQERFAQIERDLPARERQDGTGPNAVAQNPPLYYLYEAIPYRLSLFASLPARLIVMRLANIPFFLLMIVSAWLAAGEVFSRRRWPQTITAGTVALLPQLGFMAGVINPDILLAAIWALFTYLALLAVRVGPRPWLLVSLGGLTGLSMLTHGRGLALIGPLLVVLAVVLWRARPLGRRAWALAGGALAAMVPSAILAYVYSGAHGGTASLAGETGNAAGAFTLRGFVSYLWQFYFPPLSTMSPHGPAYGYRQVFVEGLAGTFGSLEIRLPLWTYDLLQLAAAGGILLLLGVLVRQWERIRRHTAQLIVLAGLPVCVLGLLHLAAFRQIQAGSTDPLLVGRYLLPIVVVMGLAIAVTCVGLPRRAGALLGSLVLTTFALVSLAGLTLTISRFYA